MKLKIFLLVFSFALFSSPGWTQDAEDETEDLFSEFDEETPVENQATPNETLNESESANTQAQPQQAEAPPENAQPTQETAPAEEAPLQNAQEPTPAENPPAEKAQQQPPQQIPEPEQQPPPTMTSSAPPPIDNPDFNKEERFHRTYKNFNQKPTSSEIWGKAIEQKRTEVYRVQKGDTLWDVSQVLFGDPNFWPKIWSLNSTQVLNPHEISPGMAIHFFPGSMSEAPAVGIPTYKSEESKAIPARPLAQGDEKIPDPLRVYPPLMKSVPQSLPSYKFGLVNKPKENVIIEEFNRKPVSPKMFLTYYLSEDSVGSVGEIKETEQGSATASEFQYVFVKISDATQKTFHAVREIDPLKYGNLPKVNIVEVQGEIEIIEAVNSSEGIYRALVKKSLTPIHVGAKLKPGPLPKYDSAQTAVTSGVNAEIIGGEYSNKRTFFSENALVFMSQGSAAGLQLEQSLPVYSNAKIRNEKSQVIFNNRQIGVVKIVSLSQNFSVGYVVKAQDDLRLGDLVGGTVHQAAGSIDVGGGSEGASAEAALSNDSAELDMGAAVEGDSGNSNTGGEVDDLETEFE